MLRGEDLEHQREDGAGDPLQKLFPALRDRGARVGDLYEFKDKVLLDDLTRATILRAVLSERQLCEVMVQFWSDHFNIDPSKAEAKWLKAADDRDVVRAHALGNFRDLVRASAVSPAMLWYLDGRANRVANAGDKPNENYARELLELHTLGVHGGYTQQDVMEVARCLTGWTVRDRKKFFKGRVEFNARQHDDGPKRVLGADIPSGLGAADLDRVLEIVVRHPQTARHIAWKLCRRFIADEPPEEAMQAGVDAFLANLDAPDQLAQVVRAIVTTDAFLNSWGSKVKRPLETAFNAIRAIDATLDRPTEDLSWMLSRMGQPMFEHVAPNGYPDVRDAWTSTVGVLTRWQFTAMLAHGWITEWNEAYPDKSRPLFLFDLVSQSPSSRTARDLAAFWPERLLGRPLQDEGVVEDLARFLAGDAFGVDDPISDDEYLRWRLPGLVNLVFMSPDFLLR